MAVYLIHHGAGRQGETRARAKKTFPAKAGPTTNQTSTRYLRALRITNLGVDATCSTPRNKRASLVW